MDYNISKEEFPFQQIAFKRAKEHTTLNGGVFKVAQELCGLIEGKKGDREHHQPCPFCGGKDRFYYREDEETFHCRQCGFNGDIFDIVAKQRNISNIEAFNIVAEAVGYPYRFPKTATQQRTQPAKADSKPPVKQPVKPPAEPQKKEKTDYYFCNEKCEHVHKVSRIDIYDRDGNRIDKAFYSFRPDGRGGWEKGEPAVLYPYHLDEILLPDTDVLYICEGEKAAESLRKDFIAAGCFLHNAVTTNSGGCKRANLWLDFVKRFPELLKKKIRILPDNDSEGTKAARTTARAFLEAGATDVKIIALPNIQDIPKADYVQCHKLHEEGANDNPAVAAITYLQACCERTEYCTLESLLESLAADSLPPAADGETQPAETKQRAKDFMLIGGYYADVQYKPIEWLWRGHFAKKMLHCIHGDGDAGKGYFSFWLASIVSTGGTFPDGQICQKGCVLTVGSEEEKEYCVGKLSAQHAELRNTAWLTGYKDGDSEFPISLFNINLIQEMCDRIERERQLPVSLIIVDPLLQMLGVKANDNTDVQSVLAPVKEFAERQKACFLCINHNGKAAQETAANRSIGAVSIQNKMRVAYELTVEKTMPEEGCYPIHSFKASKFNIGKKPKGIDFHIVDSPDIPEMGKVEILDCEVPCTADDKPAAQSSGKLDACVAWMRQFLADVREMGRLKDEVIEEGEKSGFGKNLIYGAFKQLEKTGQAARKRAFSGKQTWILTADS